MERHPILVLHKGDPITNVQMDTKIQWLNTFLQLHFVIKNDLLDNYTTMLIRERYLLTIVSPRLLQVSCRLEKVQLSIG